MWAASLPTAIRQAQADRIGRHLRAALRVIETGAAEEAARSRGLVDEAEVARRNLIGIEKLVDAFPGPTRNLIVFLHDGSFRLNEHDPNPTAIGRTGPPSFLQPSTPSGTASISGLKGDYLIAGGCRCGDRWHRGHACPYAGVNLEDA